MSEPLTGAANGLAADDGGVWACGGVGGAKGLPDEAGEAAGEA
ncbi:MULTISPECIES: hypothetical protein [Streptomyces]|nr:MULTISPECIES: hypothetical protein [Streptomyces]